MNNLPFVSIVVPALNEEKHVKDCVLSLRNQNYPKDRYEIVVVDNGSKDNTVALLEELGVAYYIQKKRGRPSALNLGINKSKGEIIAMTDIDCLTEHDWLSKIVAGFKDESIGCVAGEIKILGPDNIPIVKFQKQKGYFSPVHLKSASASRPSSGCGGSLAFRRAVFDKIGLFDESFIRGQEVEICWRMQTRTGYKINYCLDVLAWHRCETTLFGFLKQRFRISRGQALLRRKYNEKFKKPTLKERYWLSYSLFTKALNILSFWFKGTRNKELKERAYDEFVTLAMSLAELFGQAYWALLL